MKNPFKILAVTPNASKAEIVKHAAQAMQKGEYDLKTIAEAQKELLNPVTRAAAEFIHVLELEDQFLSPTLDQTKQTTCLELELLSCFDEQNRT